MQRLAASSSRHMHASRAPRTAERHLAAEVLLEEPEVVAGGQRLVDVLAEDVLTHHLGPWQGRGGQRGVTHSAGHSSKEA